jgi:nitrate/TMAO reductase-like tetraheme cytochrome c subunit
MKNKIIRNIFSTLLILFVFMLLFAGSYTWWNAANPEKTCASCHEINPSFETWTSSAHREISCFKCHGTALESGWHSFSEKAKMVFSHVKSAPHSDEIQLTEKQVLETMNRCKSCHENEYANWLASGHSANYSHIFLDEKHNTTEQLNFDCLRCHGMFYEGTVLDLVEPVSLEGPWKMIDKEHGDLPAIPCQACHNIHTLGKPATRPDYSNPNFVFYGRKMENNSIGLYSRHEKIHFDLANLPTPVMLNGNDTVLISADPVYRLCVQCHASSVWHQAGQGDDLTPTGVHEGISCRACHEPHSNYQRNSCDKCHPGISNCKLDVKTMNTTYFSPSSEHDIHSVSCADCHKDGRGTRTFPSP